MPTTKEELENIILQLEGAEEYVVVSLQDIQKTAGNTPINTIIKTSEVGNTAALYMLLMNSQKFDSAKRAVMMWGLRTGHFVMTKLDVDNLVEKGEYPKGYSGNEFDPQLPTEDGGDEDLSIA